MVERSYIHMKNEKGIFSKLLMLVGAVLVAVGVFAFQGGSRADDAVVVPVDTGSLGLFAGQDVDNLEGDTSTDENIVSDVTDENESQAETTSNTYAIKYYNSDVFDDESALVLADTYEGIENEHIFVISSMVPEGEAEFLAWYDTLREKYYVAGDEVVLNTENPELRLVARFAVTKQYALEYDVDGGVGTPNSQVCESYLDTCEFKISEITPTRDGYEFKGWRVPGEDTIYTPGAPFVSHSQSEPIILKAVWAEIRTYTLLYEGNGGSGSPEPQVCRSADGYCKFVVSDVTPTRVSFEFIDWQKADEAVGPGVEITVSESVTILVANWNPVAVFTLEYVADDAKDIPEPQKCESTMGTCTFILADKEPTKDGYRFKGWRLEDKEDMLAKAGDELIVGLDGPLTLRMIAVWSKIYTVLNSGEVFGAGERVVLRTAANYTDFKELTIDSELVPEEYFTINEGGGTSVLLSNAFAQALSAGEHAFSATWADGEAHGIISVNQSEDGAKRFVIVDVKGNTDAASLMLRPKAGAVSKESIGGGVVDSAKDEGESSFDAVRTLIIVAVAAFIVVYIVNRFYLKHKMEFIENFK